MNKLFTVLYVIFVGISLCTISAISQAEEAPKEIEIIYSPNYALNQALTDIKTLPPDIQVYTRYISLYNIPKKDRVAAGTTISFVINSLSTRRKMYIPAFVDKEQTLVRINLDDYDISRETWEKFVQNGSGPKAFPEPYFHVLVEKELVDIEVIDGVYDVVVAEASIYDRTDPDKVIGKLKQGQRCKVIKSTTTKTGAIWFLASADGVSVESFWIAQKNCKAVETKKTNKKERIQLPAPWLDPQAIGQLYTLSDSHAPIIRSDWFTSYAILAPAYYDFLKLGKNLKDFEELVFADEKKAEKAHLQDKGIVVQSSVARNNRTLTRSSSLTGYIWISHDTATSVGPRQYVKKVLDEDFDATEDIGKLPNGLQAYFLTNGKLERQDVALADIAVDKTAVDTVVRAGRSCMICHSDGIRPIDDEIRGITELLTNKDQVKLLVRDKKDYYRVQDLFGSDMNEVVTLDQQSYQNAVNAATGLDMRVNAQNLATIYDDYIEKLVSRETMAREIGIPVAELNDYIKSSIDNVPLGALKKPKIRPIRRDQWEESFGSFMTVIDLVKQAKAKQVHPEAAKEAPKK